MILFLWAMAIAASPQFIEVNLDVTIEGKKLTTIKALAEAGKLQTLKQKINQDMYTIELLPKVENGDELHLAFKVMQNKKIVSSPEVITFDQQEASLELGNAEKPLLELTVTPKIL